MFRKCGSHSYKNVVATLNSISTRGSMTNQLTTTYKPVLGMNVQRMYSKNKKLNKLAYNNGKRVVNTNNVSYLPEEDENDLLINVARAYLKVHSIRMDMKRKKRREILLKSIKKRVDEHKKRAAKDAEKGTKTAEKVLKFSSKEFNAELEKEDSVDLLNAKRPLTEEEVKEEMDILLAATKKYIQNLVSQSTKQMEESLIQNYMEDTSNDMSLDEMELDFKVKTNPLEAVTPSKASPPPKQEAVTNDGEEDPIEYYSYMLEHHEAIQRPDTVRILKKVMNNK
mmetsp:Transcript_5156/g.7636  ORF Transcript_5156/g.7636 Transcript_5156/m.7636 type:complete len:282 (-) Transcript_5156:30-875(-)